MDESPTIPQLLATALVDLGTTVDQVADTLLLHGVTGTPRNGSRCPVTRWVTRQVPQVAHLFRCVVGGDQPWLWITPAFLEGVLHNGQRVEIPVPVAVGDFIADFDRGAFSWLVEAPAVAA